MELSISVVLPYLLFIEALASLGGAVYTFRKPLRRLFGRRVDPLAVLNHMSRQKPVSLSLKGPRGAIFKACFLLSTLALPVLFLVTVPLGLLEVLGMATYSFLLPLNLGVQFVYGLWLVSLIVLWPEIRVFRSEHDRKEAEGRILY